MGNEVKEQQQRKTPQTRRPLDQMNNPSAAT